MSLKQKHIILDRDGVINYNLDNYVKNADEFRILPGSLQAIAALYNAGYTISIATNQSGIGKKLYDEITLELIHKKLREMLRAYRANIKYIAHCPHLSSDNCNCRKPKPGLFLQIQKYLELDSLAHIIAVGDSLRDIVAAKAAGCGKFYLVKTGHGESTLRNYATELAHVKVKDNLEAVVMDILKNE